MEVNDETVQNILRVAIDVIGAERPEGYFGMDVQRANEEAVFATRFGGGAIPTKLGQGEEWY